MTKETPSARTAPGPRPSRKLYSICGAMRDRAFVGEFETNTGKYQFEYLPTGANLKEGKLELIGRFTLQSARGAAKSQDKVKALIISQQGSIGGPPMREGKMPAQPVAARDDAPVTEATGSLSSYVALFGKLSPLDGRKLGLPLDTSGVQLNARLAAREPLERELHWLYSAIISAAYSQPADATVAGQYIAELDRMLQG